MSGGRRKKHKAENSESLIKELTSFAKECGEVRASDDLKSEGCWERQMGEAG